MTNQGLEKNATHWRHKVDPTLCLVGLNCGDSFGRHVGIYLRLVDNRYDRIRTNELCDMKRINNNDWTEVRNVPILIRAHNYLNQSAFPSIFSLQYPKQIQIGAKYFVDFATTFPSREIRRLDEFPHSALVHGLGENELLMDPNKIVFINVELQSGRVKSQYDIIINLTENSFPTVGILARSKDPWKRLGDPLKQQTSEIYGGLGHHLYFKLPLEPTYPMMAKGETTNHSVAIHLLPRPPKRRLLNLPPEHVNSVTLREYVFKNMVEQDER